MKSWNEIIGTYQSIEIINERIDEIIKHSLEANGISRKANMYFSGQILLGSVMQLSPQKSINDSPLSYPEHLIQNMINKKKYTKKKKKKKNEENK